MQEQDIQELLEKYRKGQATPEELEQLETWYLHWHNEPVDISHPEIEAVQEEVWNAVDPGRKKNRWLGSRVAAAVAALIIMCIGTYFYHPEKTPIVTPAIVKTNIPLDFKPGRNVATLTLSDGKTVSLGNLASGRISDQGTIAVEKQKDGFIIYHDRSGNKTVKALAVKNTLATPRGGEYHLTLSDGTQVWLNAASSITFPVKFNEEGERVVEVNGEAYFEVSHRDGQTFKVITGKQQITVLGTHFNVKAYDDDNSIKTTLLSGSVDIKDLGTGQTILLKPRQQARFAKTGHSITIKAVNPDDAVSWKNGYFVFDDQGIRSVMTILSRWYDVDIAYEGNITSERFGGTFSRSANLSEILKNLELLGNIRFNALPRKIIVSKKN